MAQIERIIDVKINPSGAVAGGAAVTGALTDVGKSADRSTKRLERFNRSQRRTNRQTKILKGSLVGLGGSLLSLFAGQRAIKEISSFEKALISVAKTTDLTNREMVDMGRGLDDLSRQLGVPVTRLSDYARFAGQMGVRGVPQLEKFSETVARMSMTLDDMDPNEAAKELAQFLAITGRGDDDIFKLGNAATKLGNDFRATEDQIIRSSVEIAKSLKSFDVGPELSLALGTTLATLRTRPELASSAMFRAFKQINKAVLDSSDALDVLGEISGKSAEQFQEIWGNSQYDALTLFLEGLGKFQSAGGNVSEVLSVLGLKGSEVGKVLPSLAAKVDTLKRAFTAANTEMNFTPERLGAMQRESDRVLTSFDRSIKRLGTTSSSAFRSIVDSMASTGEFKLFTDDLVNAISLIAGLDNATEDMTTRSKAFAVALKSVGIMLAFVAAVKITMFFTEMASSIVGVLTNLPALIASLSALYVILAGLTAFKFGSYMYSEFRVVRETMVDVIEFLSDSVNNIKFAFMSLMTTVKIAFRGFIEFLAQAVGGLTSMVAKMVVSYGILRNKMPGGKEDFKWATETASELEKVADNMNNLFGKTRFDSSSGLGGDFLKLIDQLGELQGSQTGFSTSSTLVPFSDLGEQALRSFHQGFASNVQSSEDLNIISGHISKLLDGIQREGTKEAFFTGKRIVDAYQSEIEKLEEADVRIPSSTLLHLRDFQRQIAKMENEFISDDSLAKISKEGAGAAQGKTSTGFLDFLKKDMDRFTDHVIPNFIDVVADKFLGLTDQIERQSQKDIAKSMIGRLNGEPGELDILKEQSRVVDEVSVSTQLFTEDQRNAQRALRELSDELSTNTARINMSTNERERAILVQEWLTNAVEAYSDDQDFANEKLNQYTQGLIGLDSVMTTFGTNQGRVNKELSSYIGLLDLARDTEASGAIEGKLKDMQDSALDRFSNFKKISLDVADSFASSFEDGFMRVIEGTRSIGDAFRDMMRVVLIEATKQSVAKPMAGLLGSLVGSFTSSLTGGMTTGGKGLQNPNHQIMPNALGNIFAGGFTKQFANGGIIGNETLFPMANGGVGSMAEGNKPEAIMPLSRDSSGKLGVKAAGGNGMVQNITNNMYVTTPDVRGFKMSQKQLREKMGAI